LQKVPIADIDAPASETPEPRVVLNGGLLAASIGAAVILAALLVVSSRRPKRLWAREEALTP
jgi:hypothetical protein